MTRGVRCAHCGAVHEIGTIRCPTTGRLIKLTGRTIERGLASSKLGEVIRGRYELMRVLGIGGMGTVFEATDRQTGKTLAVKVLSTRHALKKTAVQRFLRETRAAAAIQHPNVCAVFESGTTEGDTPYFVMERLHGETLADRIAKRRKLPYDQAVGIMAQVLAGLDAAHRVGVIHRDVKPENIFLVEREGSATVPIAKVFDFGVAKAVGPLARPDPDDEDDDHDLTRTGMVMGTPCYMAPEQARGDRGFDARVDVFASGVILYEVLAGRRPFSAPTHNALLLEILTATPTPLRNARRDMPPELEAIVARAMARSRSARYPSADAFRRDLVAFSVALAQRTLVNRTKSGAGISGAAPSASSVPAPDKGGEFLLPSLVDSSSSVEAPSLVAAGYGKETPVRWKPDLSAQPPRLGAADADIDDETDTLKYQSTPSPPVQARPPRLYSTPDGSTPDGQELTDPYHDTLVQKEPPDFDD